MKNKTIFALSSLILGLIFTSCSAPVYNYMPAKVNYPTISQKAAQKAPATSATKPKSFTPPSHIGHQTTRVVEFHNVTTYEMPALASIKMVARFKDIEPCEIQAYDNDGDGFFELLYVRETCTSPWTWARFYRNRTVKGKHGTLGYWESSQYHNLASEYFGRVVR